jgi:hypothetical protein
LLSMSVSGDLLIASGSICFAAGMTHTSYASEQTQQLREKGAPKWMDWGPKCQERRAAANPVGAAPRFKCFICL